MIMNDIKCVLQMDKNVWKACEHVLTMFKDSVLEYILINGEVINAVNQDILGTFRYDVNEFSSMVLKYQNILGLFAQDVYIMM
ncbi:hypothetical protein AN396_12280 [Candidatus Epulonipiscium fishelsonii]|uniref:Uncharacterized protein n=1 Tax=Candidatus Epulonipiscium fishelsonii TaxID=77094 RepID=A0ACC8X805_9FIRM|nr:hypothetical protein AN396_12280 [Epulopiscium sp. SCG-B11WGA-EpuloA1]